VLLAARGRSRRREPPRSGLPQFPFARVWLGAALDVRLAHPPRAGAERTGHGGVDQHPGRDDREQGAAGSPADRQDQRLTLASA